LNNKGTGRHAEFPIIIEGLVVESEGGVGISDKSKMKDQNGKIIIAFPSLLKHFTVNPETHSTNDTATTSCTIVLGKWSMNFTRRNTHTQSCS
jgi:hypothetical protein